jgi:hypothetical protein
MRSGLAEASQCTAAPSLESSFWSLRGLPPLLGMDIEEVEILQSRLSLVRWWGWWHGVVLLIASYEGGDVKWVPDIVELEDMR